MKGPENQKEIHIPDEMMEVLKGKQLESVGILAGGIAQDFNALLSIIIGNISLARMEVVPETKIYKLLAEAEKASLQAADLAEKLITFSGGGWLVRREERLPTILEELLQSGALDDRLSYKLDIPYGLSPIFVDEGQLRQVFLNILHNAAEAMPDGGEIVIRAENVSLRNPRFGTLQAGNYVKVKIEDQGRGIPPEHMDKIFDPYFTTKDNLNQQGMGLGLAISYSIIKKHKGHIAVKSIEGQGTVVTLYIPAFTIDHKENPIRL